jgi:DNA-binding LytR/AlgR family response regulator
MPKISGFDLLKTMMNPPRIIVTSAHQEFALEGYELNISDYLLKPFSLERFMKAINKAINVKKSIEPIPIKEPAKFSFFLKGDKKMHQVHTEDILYIEAFGNYTKVYFENEMIVSHEKISSFEELLPVENFLRIHKSFIIATNKIKLIEGNRISIGEHRVPIGQTYKIALKKLFKNG